MGRWAAVVIGVVIPTVHGRETMLRDTVDAYWRDAPLRMALEIVRDFPTCGQAWNEGARRLLRSSTIRYLHFGADDLVPHPDWWRPARRAVDAGELPAAFLFDADGKRNQEHDGAPGARVTFSRVPFLTREQWQAIGGEIPPLHYFSDVWIGEAAWLLGRVETRLVAGYAFTHLWAQPGRKHDDAEDRAVYDAAMEALCASQ